MKVEHMTELPIVIEDVLEDKIEWLLSFSGSNPEKDDCINLTKDQCFWLKDKIMNIDPNLLRQSSLVAK